MIAVLLLPVFFLTGCASIVGKDMFPLTINSNPDGASVLIKDENGIKVYSGTTPTTAPLAAGEAYFHAKEYNITLSKEGYENQYIQVKASLSGWYFGNILFGGLIGLLIVDPITGKMWKLRTNVWGELSQKASVTPAAPATPAASNNKQGALNKSERILQIVSLEQIPENMRKDLVALN